MIGVIVVLLVLGTFTIGFVAMYNSLVQLGLRCDSAWSDNDVQLERQHDLILNLVDTVKRYAAHEKGTVEEIAKLRSKATLATTSADKAATEGQLTGSLKTLFGVAENYPSLKASRGVYATSRVIESNGRFDSELTQLIQLCRPNT